MPGTPSGRVAHRCRGWRGGVTGPLWRVAGRGAGPRSPHPAPVTCPDDPQPPDRSPDGCPGAAGLPRRSASAPSARPAAPRRPRPPPRRPWWSSAPAASPGATCPVRRRPRCGRCCEHGATASLTVRSVHSNTCPGGRLADPVGRAAGRRPGHRVGHPAAVPSRARAGRDGAVPGWDAYRRIAAGKDFDARIGLLGDELTRGVGCVRAVGPGAALGAATSAGKVTDYAPYDARTLPRDPGGLPGDAGGRRRRARPGRGGPARRGAPDAPRGRRRSGPSTPGSGRCWPPRRANADVLVASLSDAGASERLRLAALRGPGVRRRHPGVDLDPAGRAGPARPT